MRLETVDELHELVARYVPEAAGGGRRAARMIGDAG
jgi:hypothetical protein